MAEKDAWDKFDIVFKSFVLGLIPIVIAFAADTVAQSVKRGELIQSLVENLSKQDARRDIALIALDEAIPPQKECDLLWLWRCESNPDHDPVVQIAAVLINSSIDEALEHNQSPKELSVAKKIISDSERGNLNYYQENFGDRYRSLEENAQSIARSSASGRPASAQEAERQANISQTLAAIQPSSPAPTVESLAGIRLVYIQYQTNRGMAEALQRDLQSKGISAPGIEQVSGIEQNNIRYANAADRQAAENLQAYLQQNQAIQFNQPIDLSASGYRVPSGQFEIWLK